MKIPQISRKEVIKKLQKSGFIAIRQKCSHIRLEKRTAKSKVGTVVPIHKGY